MPPWTPEREKTCADLWNDGLSAGQIAKRLGGTTRNAVVGKIHRMGLQGRPKDTRNTKGYQGAGRTKLNASKPKPPKSDSPSLANANAMSQNARPPASTEAASALAPLSKKHPRGIRKAFEALKPTSCCFPIGDPQHSDFTFCLARAKPGSPYCVDHGSICTSPAPTRKRAKERAYA